MLTLPEPRTPPIFPQPVMKPVAVVQIYVGKVSGNIIQRSALMKPPKKFTAEMSKTVTVLFTQKNIAAMTNIKTKPGILRDKRRLRKAAETVAKIFPTTIGMVLIASSISSS